MACLETLNSIAAQSTGLGSQSFFRERQAGDLLLTELLKPERLGMVLRSYGRRHGRNPVLTAVAGEWSKRYFAAVLKPIVAVAIMFGWRMPLAPDTICLDLNEAGDIFALCLSSCGGPVVAASAEERFDFLIKDNLVPAIDAIADVTDLSRNVLWSNAGNVFEGMARSCEARLKCRTVGISQAFEMLEKANLSDGSRNPLHRPIIYPVVDDAPKRLRRVCCVRYLLGVDYCVTCPCPQKRRTAT